MGFSVTLLPVSGQKSDHICHIHTCSRDIAIGMASKANILAAMSIDSNSMAHKYDVHMLVNQVNHSFYSHTHS